MAINKKRFPIMNDVHMHIIPGVDDGAWDIGMSFRMIYMAYEQGIRKIIATPHSSAFEENPELVQIGFQELNEKITMYYPDMKIVLGCEVYCRANAMKEILANLKSAVFLSMNETKYVLIEFSAFIEMEEVYDCVNELLNEGWVPIIAHIERYRKLFDDFALLEKLKQMGCLFQINVYSVYEENDWQIRYNAQTLIAQKMADFLGSDAHRTFHRPPCVERGLEFLYETYEKEYVDAIAFGNAEKILL